MHTKRTGTSRCVSVAFVVLISNNLWSNRSRFMLQWDKCAGQIVNTSWYTFSGNNNYSLVAYDWKERSRLFLWHYFFGDLGLRVVPSACVATVFPAVFGLLLHDVGNCRLVGTLCPCTCHVPKFCSLMNMTSKSKNVKLAKFISCIFELFWLSQ